MIEVWSTLLRVCEDKHTAILRRLGIRWRGQDA